jgi:hypothetical protein
MVVKKQSSLVAFGKSKRIHFYLGEFVWGKLEIFVICVVDYIQIIIAKS